MSKKTYKKETYTPSPLNETYEAGVDASSKNTDESASVPETDPAFVSVMNGISDGLNNRFDRMDNKKKAILILILAILCLIGGLVYMYLFAKSLFF